MTKPLVRPDVQSFLEAQNARAAPAGIAHDLPAIRKMSAQAMMHLDVPIGDIAVVQDCTVPGAAGDRAARLFDTRTDRAPGAVLIYIHGGGFSNLSIDTHSSLAAELARQLDLPVLSISYRLAPEDPWPAAPDDVESAVRWIATNGAAFDRTFTGLILAGDSAGGNLAAVAATALREQPAALPVVLQALIYPKLDWRGEYPSMRDFASGYGLSPENMRLHHEHYAPDEHDWRASPLVADPAGLPPTVVITASLDPLRDEGRAYAARCIEAGVPTLFWEAEGQLHGFATFRRMIPSAVADVQAMADLMKAALGLQGPGR